MSGSPPSSERYYELALRMALWGDSKEKILKRLQVNGLSDSQAAELWKRVFGERVRLIRAVYWPQVLLGGALFVVSGVVIFGYLFLSQGFVVGSKFLMIPALVFAWGAVKLGRGLSGWMGAPHREGPVADFE